MISYSYTPSTSCLEERLIPVLPSFSNLNNCTIIVFAAAHSYFKYALLHIKKKFPFREELLANTEWINVNKRIEANWENMDFFFFLAKVFRNSVWYSIS